MGVTLDAAANDRNATRISSTASDVDGLVIPTDEESVAARATHALTNTGANTSTIGLDGTTSAQSRSQR